MYSRYIGDMSQYTSDICTRYARDIPEIYHIYAKYISNLFLGYIRIIGYALDDILDICLIYSGNMAEIPGIYQRND